jgi:hypothetical protein
MPSLTFTIEYQSEPERAALERAFAFVTEMHQLAQTAPSGAVLALCEAHALDQGRRLLRDTLQSAAQARIDHAEQKGAPLVSARALAATASRAATNATF